MNSIDLTIVLLLGMAFFIGFKNGFVKTVISLVSWIIGIYIAILYGENLTVYIHNRFNLSAELTRIVSFAAVFLLVVLAFNLIAQMITKALSLIMMGMLNRILGGVFNVIKYSVVLSFIIMVVNSSYSYRILSEEKRENSFLYEPIATIAPAIFPAVKKNMENFDLEWIPGLEDSVEQKRDSIQNRDEPIISE